MGTPQLITHHLAGGGNLGGGKERAPPRACVRSDEVMRTQ
jgi:hypothetical protein